MDVQQEKPKRRQKQLYFGNREDQLWEWVQSLPKQEGNAEICAILNYYLYGGVKPKTPSCWDMVEKKVIDQDERIEIKPNSERKIQDTEIEDDLLR